MAGLGFQIRVAVKDNLSPMAARARDLSPAFMEIVNAWTDGNLGKFEAAEGAEMSGVQFSTVGWQALKSMPYIKQKRRRGYDDWLMHATGALMESMIDKESMSAGAQINPTAVSFGFPPALDEPMKILGNWERRQVIFLSEDDMAIIQQLIFDYINAEGRFVGAKITNEPPPLSASEEMDFGQ